MNIKCFNICGDKMKFSFKNTIYAGYIGYITQAIVNNLAPLLFIIFRDSLGVELSKITLIITVNFFIQLGVDLLSSKFVDKIGYRPCIVAAHIFSAVGLVLMGVLPTVMSNAFAGLLISAMLYAIGGGLIEVLISPIVEACPTDNKASAMSLLHSFYCWGSVAVILISTILLRVLGKDSWQIIAVCWAIIPAINALLFAKVPINTLAPEGKENGTRRIAKNKTFWLFMIIMVCAGASELSMSQWASALAETGLGVSKAVGDLAGPCMFSLLMGTARVITSRLSKKINLASAMLFCGILCTISYLLTALSGNAVFSLVGCGICGLSVGIMWPGAFSMASEHFKSGTTAMFALLALAGDLGCMTGPTLVGAVAGMCQDNLKAGLMFGIIFPILLSLCCIILNRSKSKANA